MKPKLFRCCLTVSEGVEEKLAVKHALEVWEVEEALYDDPHAFALRHEDCYFAYGRSFAGRYILALVRILSSDEVVELGLDAAQDWVRLITARDMNRTQRRQYNRRKSS